MTRTMIRTPAGEVSARFDGPADARPVVVLGHGAGAGMDSEFMATMAEGLAARDARVVRFNFAYAEHGRRSPDKQSVLEDTFRAVAESVRPADGGLVLGGKSLGGRIASHVVTDGLDADGLVFLGYPLHPPGRPDRLRIDHLPRIDRPMLFVEGSRDPFCPLDTLTRVLEDLSIAAEVAVIDDGDHSFKVRKSSGRTTSEAWAEAVNLVAEWLHRVRT